MRQLGTVADQTSAQRFGDFLLTKGISVSVDPAPGGWAIWVRNEDHLDDARVASSPRSPRTPMRASIATRPARPSSCEPKNSAARPRRRRISSM